MTPRSAPPRATRGLTLGLLVLCAAAAAHPADAPSGPSSAWDEGSESRPVSSVEDDLDFDENGKLSAHYLVFPAGRPDCPTRRWDAGRGGASLRGGAAGSGFRAHPLEGDALRRVFPHYGTGGSYLGRDPYGEIELAPGEGDARCLAACLEKGTDRAVAGQTMPHHHWVGVASAPAAEREDAFDGWFSSECQRVEVCFINYVARRPLEVFWFSEDGEWYKEFDLEYGEGETRCFHSFIGHEFEAADEASGFRERVSVGHMTTMAFGESPPSSTQRFEGIHEVEETVREALDEEWRKHKVVNRTFSSLGFAKGRLPDDVFASIAAFYYNNRESAVNEEWEGNGVFVNWWETDVKFLPIPWDAKLRWQLRLSELVGAWAGVEVEETSMYGLRRYETGARLLSHVDRLPTHAVSLIVNVAQRNLANPWPVEVFDHADRLHEVDMAPGDVVYYESAKNLHSRNRPLTCRRGGCEFVNLFTHYRPVHDGARWYRNMDDVPNRPPPLVQGEVDFDTNTSACVLDNETRREDGADGGNVLGVGTVRCNDPRLGPWMSPTLFRLRGADDLFRWWKATENAHLIGFDESKEAIYHCNKDAMAEAYEKPPQHRPWPATEALDGLEECPRWAEEGECESNPDYMMENCGASCSRTGAAREEASAAEQQYEEDGGDAHEDCSMWADQAECEKNPGWMQVNCKKSCREAVAIVADTKVAAVENHAREEDSEDEEESSEDEEGDGEDEEDWEYADYLDDEEDEEYDREDFVQAAARAGSEHEL